jgi:MIP family channel proteins
MKYDLIRRLTAEFLGTFALVFIGGGAVVMDAAKGGALGLPGIALAHAAVLAVMVSALMNISGAHFNPAVTFAIWMSNRLDLGRSAAYIVVQLVGAVVAAFAVKALLPALAGQATSYGVPRVAGDLTMMKAIMTEAILTLFLLSAIFGTCVSREAPKVGGFAIGITLLADILLGGPATGAAMNPARAFGPALVGNDWHAHAVYWIGPFLGAAVAALVWSKILLPLPEGAALSEAKGKREEGRAKQRA